MKKNTEILIDANEKAGPEVNTKETKHMLYQNSEQYHNTKIDNRAF
jgi:hypothetical protein